MLTGLFRQQALESQKERLHGEVLVLPSLSFSFCTVVLVLWVSAVVAWLVNSEYARKETVAGWLEPPSGVLRIYPNIGGGQIEDIFVTQGQKVTADQPLLTINGHTFLSDGNSLEDNLLEEYYQQSIRLQEQLARSETIHNLELQNTEAHIQSLREDLARLDEQLSTLAKQRALEDKRNNNLLKIQEKGHVPEIELDNAKQKLLALHSEQQSLLREKVNQEARLSRLENQLKLAPQVYQNDRAALETQLSELAQSTQQLKGKRSRIIRAPRDGVVTNLQIKQGQQLVNNKPLLTLIPEQSEIQAQLLLPVRAAGFVEKGQSIEIRYDAFPYQKFGLYKGEILSISESVMLPDELGVSPVGVNEPVYLIRARLAQQHVSGYGRSLSLKSGMTLSADVHLSNRTLLEWLLEPLYSLRGRL